ncbi:TetR/AcrR family transcriptional regulator [Roseibium polysiphoniae]|uniref:TetR/AcrR family transcriptional regulator n=2 Tax=Roseibium polysiphoniae TaxID=2571221 RepID=A0A944CFG5_9HYPH|nr:TetR/AcrR family transcriptional regulator [Roseibium polysiphoniae]
MNATMTKIASGLEHAFALRGFAEPSVEDLREAAGVSLRTLYKYTPSRDDMVLAALEHRHQRYLASTFDDLPEDQAMATDSLMERIGAWMLNEASHGCLFHAAVAAAPGDARLRALLERHKGEVSERAARACGLTQHQVDLNLIIEGLMQSWPIHSEEAVASAKRLSGLLRVRTCK